MTARRLILLLAILATTVVVPARAQQPLRSPDVIFVPTPQEVVDAMLKLAKVTKNDVIYDLGSGDGRIPITAAKTYGARGVGIDIDPQRIKEATENLKTAGVGDRVKFLNQDLFTTDISEATVVTLYLLPSLNVKLIPKLNKELKPGTRDRLARVRHERRRHRAEAERDAECKRTYCLFLDNPHSVARSQNDNLKRRTLQAPGTPDPDLARSGGSWESVVSQKAAVIDLRLDLSLAGLLMLQAFVITLREGLEAFLIVAISLAYLRKTGRPGLVSAVHWGIGVSIVVSIAPRCSFNRHPIRRCGRACSRSSPQCSWRRSSCTCGVTRGRSSRRSKRVSSHRRCRPARRRSQACSSSRC